MMRDAKLFSDILHHLKTIYLFTHSDYKTIFFPVTMFAAVVAPLEGRRQLFYTAIWVWFHLLQANVSNQTFSADEDVVNKPWRPLPAGRISVQKGRSLRWYLMFFCLGLSSLFGPGVLFSSAALSLVEIIHDDLGLSGHPIFKNLCNVGGYITFELGATLVIAPRMSLDRTTLVALAISALLIFTTIHAQDFADTEGDRVSGRQTLPIIAPEGSRIYILGALVTWSFVLAIMWDLGPLSGAIFLAMGAIVGTRYFIFREQRNDEFSYVLYNVWLLTAHLLPVNARVQLLTW